MTETRFLIRLENRPPFTPPDVTRLLFELRRRMGALTGWIANPRVTPIALEFDLFVNSPEDVPAFLEAWEPLGKALTVRRLGGPAAAREPAAIIAEARQFFNEYRYWEAHETLEELWLRAAGSEKRLVQGLILIAAALVHAQRNEMGVVFRMIEDGLARLREGPPGYHGWDVDAFRRHFAVVAAQKKVKTLTV